MAAKRFDLNATRAARAEEAAAASGLQVHTTTSEIHRLQAKIELWRDLKEAARHISTGFSGVTELTGVARNLGKQLGFAVEEIPVAAIWFETQLARAVGHASRIEEVTQLETPRIMEIASRGFTVVFVGGPIQSISVEHKWDYWRTLDNRKIELAFRRPKNVTFSTTFFPKELEDRLTLNHGRDTKEVAQEAFKAHHRAELGSGTRALILTGAWKLSSGSMSMMRPGGSASLSRTLQAIRFFLS
jgi:hypothetical protein